MNSWLEKVKLFMPTNKSSALAKSEYTRYTFYLPEIYINHLLHLKSRRSSLTEAIRAAIGTMDFVRAEVKKGQAFYVDGFPLKLDPPIHIQPDSTRKVSVLFNKEMEVAFKNIQNEFRLDENSALAWCAASMAVLDDRFEQRLQLTIRNGKRERILELIRT